MTSSPPDSNIEQTLYRRWAQSRRVDGMVLNRVRLHDWRIQFLAQNNVPFDGYQKWILRRAVYDLLPQSVVNREKETFWEGAGFVGQIAHLAEEKVSDGDFRNLRAQPGGTALRSKEEAFYFRYFLEYFGNLKDFAWVGRTKDTADMVTA